MKSATPSSHLYYSQRSSNACVGSGYQAWNNNIEKHGVGKCNSYGLLLSLCASHNLTITNTMFSLSTCNKTSWMHSCSRHWHLIDYIITRVKDRQDAHLTEAMHGTSANCLMDHPLIVSKQNLLIQPKKRPQGQKVTN